MFWQPLMDSHSTGYARGASTSAWSELRNLLQFTAILGIGYVRPVLLAHSSLNIAGPRFEAEVLWLNYARIASGISKLCGIRSAICLFALGGNLFLTFFYCHLPTLGCCLVACDHSSTSLLKDSIVVYVSSVFPGADSTNALRNGSVSLRVSMNCSLAFPSHRRSNVTPPEWYVVRCIDFCFRTSHLMAPVWLHHIR